jgi:chromosome segregation ATPase
MVCDLRLLFDMTIGKGVPKSQVTELVKKLNIQVDNLCQFLPQDKVSNFAALSPQELLRETEKAVGSDSMLAMHDTLINLRKVVKELEIVRMLNTPS